MKEDILLMGKSELLALGTGDVGRLLSVEEVLHIATTLGAFWKYDYQAAKEGRVGAHALLKSGLHSDGFFVSRILLAHKNMLWIFAHQIVMILGGAEVPTPDYVAGIPDGATNLGASVAEVLGVREVEMRKVGGRIVLVEDIPDCATLLFVEDFCTRGTGLTEAVHAVLSKQPNVWLFPYDPVIINRGGLEEVRVQGVEGVDAFQILPIAEVRIQDWEARKCPLCASGSMPIAPKATAENWELITASQI